MKNKVVVDGMSFIASGRDYLYNSNKRLYLHRYIWEKHNGKILEGYQIHHVDKNPSNNEIENLVMLSKKEHSELHNREMSDEERMKRRDNMIANAHPKAIEWHKSEEGREWHKNHYLDCKDKLHQDVKIVCEHCNKECEVRNTGVNRFCSNACKSAYRRAKGLDNITKVCAYCKNEYQSNKYAKTTCCSKSCSSKLRVILKDSPN